jgi:hypothetical protein
VISGDTRYSQNVIKHGTGVDLLIHEVCIARPELSSNSSSSGSSTTTLVPGSLDPKQTSRNIHPAMLDRRQGMSGPHRHGVDVPLGVGTTDLTALEKAPLKQVFAGGGAKHLEPRRIFDETIARTR